MKNLFAVSFVLGLAVAACGGGGGGADKVIKLKDEACACKDKACADAVNKKLDEAMEQMMLDYVGKEPDEGTQKKLGTAMMEAGLCIAKHKK